MYILSVSLKSENVNTYEEIFAGVYLLWQKGEKIGLLDNKRIFRVKWIF